MKVSLRKGIDLRAEHLQGWLRAEKAYVVLTVEQHSADSLGFRIESEDGGQPVVFKASLFEVLDGSLPKSWRVLSVRENVLELGPEPFGQEGFWERYFDRDPEALELYRLVKTMVIADS